MIIGIGLNSLTNYIFFYLRTGNASTLVGVLVGVVFVLIALVFGAMYCWKKRKDGMQANKIALLPSAPSGTGIGNTSFTPDQSLEMIGTRYEWIFFVKLKLSIFSFQFI